jgi:tape measure domain-containing protein
MSSYVIPSIFTAVDRFTAPLAKMSMAAGNFAQRVGMFAGRAKKSIDGVFNKISGGYGNQLLAGSFGLATLAVGGFIREASKIENAIAQFTPILGGVDKATALVERLNKMAAETPFEFQHISDAVTKLLPAMNGDLEGTIRIMKMLGDASMGSADKLQRITHGYSKALLKGKVDMESLNIIGEAGVPIVPELTKTLGLKDNAALFKMLRAGDVTVASLEKTFARMTSEGGMFFNGMAIGAQTFTGQMSTVWDNIKLTAAAIGMELIPVLKEFIPEILKITSNIRDWVGTNKELIKSTAREWFERLGSAIRFIVENFDTIVTLTKWYVIALVGLKVASVAAATYTNLLAVATFAYNVALGLMNGLLLGSAFRVQGNTVAMAADTVGTWLNVAAKAGWAAIMWVVTAAQWALNVALSANPIGLIIIAIAALIALVTIIIVKYNEWGAALALLLGPLGLIINLIQAFRRNWDMITEAFSKGGILGGLKAIGKVLLDSVLMPLQQILELIAKATGAEWATNGAAGIKLMREQLGVNTTTDESGNLLPPPINPRATQADVTNEQITTNKQSVGITIDNNTDNPVAAKLGGGLVIPIRTTSTMNYGG